MSDLEFIEAWNNTIPFKIKEKDLSKPSEKFLTNAFVSYLVLLNIDAGPLVNVEDTEKRRIGKIKLTHYINHLYKLSNNTNEFFYIDLIQPAPKKTSHLLKILLNYLHFYNMLKTEVLERADTMVSKYENLRITNNNLAIENEKAKILIGNIESRTKQNSAVLPKLQEQCIFLEKKKNDVNDEMIDVVTKLKNSNYTIAQLKNQIEKSKNEIVMESEMKFLLEKLATLDKSIEEYTEIEKTGRENIYAIANLIPILKEYNKKLEDIVNIQTKLINSPNVNELYEQAVIEADSTKKIISVKNAEILDLKQKLNDIEQQYKIEHELKEQEMESITNETNEVSRQIVLQCEEETQLQCKTDNLDEEVHDLLEQRKRMIELAASTFKILQHKT